MQCIHPIPIKRVNVRGNYVDVPCGRCYPCMSNKRNQWSFRLAQQLKNSKSAYFVTLTYSDECKPLDGCLNKREIQLFLKRLRKDWHIDGLKYYLVGEYGPKTHRPHYHVIFFNLPPDPENKLISSWKHGFVSVGQVNSASIHYTTKYLITKHDAPKHLTAPFMLVSKGMGECYLAESGMFHIENQQFYSTVDGGNKIPLSSYYKNKIFTKEERNLNTQRSMRYVDKIRTKMLENLKNKGHKEPLRYLLDNQEINNQNKLELITKRSKL
nr:MAG: replication initiator protein [Microvirus sp.]